MTDKTPGWVGPRDPAQPNLDIGFADGQVQNCTTHNMGDCPYHHPPVDGLTDAEKLAALETYLKTLEPIAKALRAQVTADMGARRVERVGAYLPDGTKMAAVGYSGGRKTAKVTDSAAALKWCQAQYPEAIVQAINPAFLKAITDHSAKVGFVGEPGVDPHTGELLTFIEVVQGNPYVTVTTTTEGVDRLAALAGGFVAMLEGGPA